MKLAIVGSSGHVGYVLHSAVLGEEVDLVAAARSGPADATDYTAWGRGGPLPVHDDYRRMLDEVRPDIVCVCPPFGMNAAVSMAAAERGCHILSDKPLATELDDLARLREAVGRAGVRIAAMFDMRCRPQFQAVRQAIADGRIGRPLLAAAQKSYPFGRRPDFYRRRETYGGTIPWVAIHGLEAIAYCTGERFTRVAAMQGNLSQPEYPGAEDHGGLLLELSGGGHAVVRFDYLRPKAEGSSRRHGDDRLRIAGSAGIVEVVEEGTAVRLMTPTEVEELPLPPGIDMVASFVQSVRGEGECIVTAEDSFRMTEVALRARQAADEGRIIEL